MRLDTCKAADFNGFTGVFSLKHKTQGFLLTFEPKWGKIRKHAILGYSLAVGHVTLTHAVMVRLHLAQPRNRGIRQGASVSFLQSLILLDNYG